MDAEKMNEGGIRYFQGNARDFTPITVSADFAALRCPPCLDNDADALEDFAVPVQNAA